MCWFTLDVVQNNELFFSNDGIGVPPHMNAIGTEKFYTFVERRAELVVVYDVSAIKWPGTLDKDIPPEATKHIAHLI